MQVKFVTRAGTNNFSGSGYEYYRRDKLNANTWFNNRDGVAKPKLKQNQIGVRAGGPIVIPGLYDGHNKAFFFVNYEEVHQPSDTTRNRTMLNPAAQNGDFSYAGGAVNVLQLAAAERPARDGRSDDRASCSTDIRSATGTTGIDRRHRRQPAALHVQRAGGVDAPLSDRARGLQPVDQRTASAASYNYQKFTDYPDTLNNRDAVFPGFPVAAGQASMRMAFSSGLRSTLSRNLVNEARVGYSGAPVKFFAETEPGHVHREHRQQQRLPHRSSRTSARADGRGRQRRRRSRATPPTSTIEDTLTWLKGSHSFTFGGGYSQYYDLDEELDPGAADHDRDGQRPTRRSGLFTAANFPGASTAQPHRGAQPLRVPDRPRHADHRRRPPRRGTGKYVYEGVGHAARPPARVRRLPCRISGASSRT